MTDLVVLNELMVIIKDLLKLLNEIENAHSFKPKVPVINWNTILNTYDGNFAILQQSEDDPNDITNFGEMTKDFKTGQITIKTSIPFMGLTNSTIPCNIQDKVSNDGKYLTFLGDGKKPYALYIDVENAQIQGVRNNENFMEFGDKNMKGLKLYPSKLLDDLSDLSDCNRWCTNSNDCWCNGGQGDCSWFFFFWHMCLY